MTHSQNVLEFTSAKVKLKPMQAYFAEPVEGIEVKGDRDGRRGREITAAEFVKHPFRHYVARVALPEEMLADEPYPQTPQLVISCRRGDEPGDWVHSIQVRWGFSHLRFFADHPDEAISRLLFTVAHGSYVRALHQGDFSGTFVFTDRWRLNDPAGAACSFIARPRDVK